MSALLSSEQAAEYLGYAEYTLRSSRSTGKLSGLDTPKFIKLGSRVRYKKDDLDSWIKDASSSDKEKSEA